MSDKRRLHPPAGEPPDGGEGTPLVAAAAHTLATNADSRAVVLVEGVSDQVALEALAERRGRNLAAEAEALSREQVGTILESASGRRHEALYIVAVHLGFRQGEFLGRK